LVAVLIGIDCYVTLGGKYFIILHKNNKLKNIQKSTFFF